MAGFIVVAGILAALVYLGWFYGRVYEAQVEAQAERQDEAAYRYAAAHNKLPDPVIKTVYVDTETGEMLHGYEG